MPFPFFHSGRYTQYGVNPVHRPARHSGPASNVNEGQIFVYPVYFRLFCKHKLPSPSKRIRKSVCFSLKNYEKRNITAGRAFTSVHSLPHRNRCHQSRQSLPYRPHPDPSRRTPRMPSAVAQPSARNGLHAGTNRPVAQGHDTAARYQESQTIRRRRPRTDGHLPSTHPAPATGPNPTHTSGQPDSRHRRHPVDSRTAERQRRPHPPVCHRLQKCAHQ